MGWIKHGADRLWTQLEGSVNLHEGILGESPKVLMTPQDKESFSSRTGAVAVDMESGAIAAVASDAKIPFIAIRAVSDAFDSVLPFTALKSFDKFGRLDRVRLMRELARHPQDITRWLRMMWELRSARKTLTLVAPLLGSPWRSGEVFSQTLYEGARLIPERLWRAFRRMIFL